MTEGPRTVLQVLPALVAGGVERGTLEIAEALAGAGWRPLVASAGGPMVRPLERTSACHVALPLGRKSPIGIWRNAAALARLIRAEKVDIVHARSRAPAWAALLAAQRTGARFVTTYHGAYNEGWPGKRLYNSVMARGERVIAISEFIACHVRERHGIDYPQLRVVPRGVDPARFDPEAVAPERVAALRAAWTVPEGRKVVLLPARLTRWKGQTVLLDAATELPEDVLVVLVGEGGLRRALEKQARRLGIAGRVRIAGHADDMPAALLLADLVVHASTDPEAFGRTVIEAQAMARPVIASDLGAPRETVEEGVTGWRVAPGDPAALAAAIRRALDMPAEMRAEVGRQARRAVMERYTKRAMQDATLALYRELLCREPL